MNIQHNPLFDVKTIEQHYSEKDGVPVRYVCTSAIGFENYAKDIFYRETPHPEFGNRYFSIYTRSGQFYIGNADRIEDVTFDCVEIDGQLHYSQHRHDYRLIKDCAIDGGRAYFKQAGNLTYPVKTLCLKDGKFYET